MYFPSLQDKILKGCRPAAGDQQHKRMKNMYNFTGTTAFIAIRYSESTHILIDTNGRLKEAAKNKVLF